MANSKLQQNHSYSCVHESAVEEAWSVRLGHGVRYYLGGGTQWLTELSDKVDL